VSSQPRRNPFFMNGGAALTSNSMCPLRLRLRRENWGEPRQVDVAAGRDHRDVAAVDIVDALRQQRGGGDRAGAFDDQMLAGGKAAQGVGNLLFADQDDVV